MRNFDVVIIGGGPSGAMCGMELQKRGIRSCIIDKAVFPRDKLCGGLLTQKTVDLISTYCPDISPEEFITDSSTEVVFYHNNKKVTRFRTSVPYYFTDRRVFDYLLIERYKKLGGVLFEQIRISKDHLDMEHRTVRIGSELFGFTLIIGADGCNSLLTRRNNVKRYDSFCLEGKVVKDTAEDKELKIYFGVVRGGYGWVFPKRGYYSVGIGGDNYDRSLKKQADMFFREVIPRGATHVKGALMPSGRLFKANKLGDYAIPVGDAAGLTDPITGEGLYYALLSGVLAADSVAEAQAQAGSSRDINNTYRRNLKGLRQNIKYAYLLKKTLYHPLVLGLFMRFIKKHPSFPLFYLEQVISTNRYSYKNFIWEFLCHYRQYRYRSPGANSKPVSVVP